MAKAPTTPPGGRIGDAVGDTQECAARSNGTTRRLSWLVHWEARHVAAGAQTELADAAMLPADPTEGMPGTMKDGKEMGAWPVAAAVDTAVEPMPRDEPAAAVADAPPTAPRGETAAS